MKLLSLNVNGLKSSMDKGLKQYLEINDFDIICLQEIKCNNELLQLDNYYSYYNYCNKNGYSGTVIFTRYKPRSISCSIPNVSIDLEGRIIILEYNNFYLINVYVPNSKSGLNRVNYRMEFDNYFYKHLINLDKKKPLIVCGDLNIDLVNMNNDCLDFNDNELEEFSDFLEYGFIDTFCLTNNENQYTWVYNVKTKKVGYRLDYFIISEYLEQFFDNFNIDNNVHCSDHYPIILDINVKV